jgi:hypothetical protein
LKHTAISSSGSSSASVVVHFAFPPAKNGLDLQLPRSMAKLEVAVDSTRNRHNIDADYRRCTRRRQSVRS